jgi:hypothetical protein
MVGKLNEMKDSLPVISEFVYLGIPVTTNGIAFQVHVLRMTSRPQRAAYFFKNMGDINYLLN